MPDSRSPCWRIRMGENECEEGGDDQGCRIWNTELFQEERAFSLKIEIYYLFFSFNFNFKFAYV